MATNNANTLNVFTLFSAPWTWFSTAEDAHSVKSTALERAKFALLSAREICVVYLGGGQDAERIVDALTLCFAGMALFRMFEKCLDFFYASFCFFCKILGSVFSLIHSCFSALSSLLAKTLATIILVALLFFALSGVEFVANAEKSVFSSMSGVARFVAASGTGVVKKVINLLFVE